MVLNQWLRLYSYICDLAKRRIYMSHQTENQQLEPSDTREMCIVLSVKHNYMLVSGPFWFRFIIVWNLANLSLSSFGYFGQIPPILHFFTQRNSSSCQHVQLADILVYNYYQTTLLKKIEESGLCKGYNEGIVRVAGVQTYFAYVVNREPFLVHYNPLNTELAVQDIYWRGF